MVELEDADPAGFSLWVDGNQPSSYGTLPYIVSRRYLIRAGIPEHVLNKYNLWSGKWKASAPKDDIFEAALCAFVENTRASAVGDEESDISLYVLKVPTQHRPTEATLLAGPRSSNQRKHSTYRQVVLAADLSRASEVRGIARLLKEVLCFSPSPDTTYPLPDEFCGEATRLMQVIKGLDADADCTDYLAGLGYDVHDYHWRGRYGPFSWSRT